MRRLATRRPQFSSSAFNPNILPPVGPFATFGNVPISGLSNLSVTGGASYNAGTMIRTSPLEYDTISIGTNRSIYSDNKAVFIWCNSLIIGRGASLIASGDLGAEWDGSFTGGAGGNGGSGGGEGAPAPFSGYFGGSGGSGGGVDSPGIGYGNSYNSGFTWGTGGDGTDGDSGGGDGGPAGLGGNGFGGAGGGSAGDAEPGAGGGGGGGLIGVVANTITTSGLPLHRFNAIGGDGGPNSTDFNQGGSGGGGVIWVACRKYTGGIDALVDGGNPPFFGSPAAPGIAKIYSIRKNNLLVLESFGTTWDYLS